MSNLYDAYFTSAAGDDAAPADCALAAATAYLDGKAAGASRKITRSQRDADFWSCVHWEAVQVDAWRSSVMTLALARYFQQEHIANLGLLDRIAAACPQVLVKAVRRSGLVLLPAPVRRSELMRLGARHAVVAELSRVLVVFAQAHLVRIELLDKLRVPFASLAPFELLILASLHAFEHRLPSSLGTPQRHDGSTSADELAWRAINDILLWRLAKAAPSDFELSDASIGVWLARHLVPVLHSVPGTQDAGSELRERFRALVEAQTELNAFISRSADAFSFDDGIEFVRNGAVLKIVQVDDKPRAAWQRDGRKLARLHEYWFYRAMDAFLLSDMAFGQIGLPQNHEANRLAWIRTLRTHMQFTQVYGIAETVEAETGKPVDLFRALLSLELMSAFFQRDFLQAFLGYLRVDGDWRGALRRLVTGGIAAGLQNRFPLTWSDRADKITKITGWTVSSASPKGDASMAGAILDFWSSDWAALSDRLRGCAAGLQPQLLERPVLKFGHLLVQLPWLVGLQDNSTAALNNLRRLGQRRGQMKQETQRIESSLAKAFQARGFAVVANWMPEAATHGDAGEVDVACGLDAVVLVLECPSAKRSSMRARLCAMPAGRCAERWPLSFVISRAAIRRSARH